MSETSGRLLSLLSLLQTPREWPGPELADRLHVTTRTVRNDVERLRALGYPVEATRGPIGGYKLVAGTAMPPPGTPPSASWTDSSAASTRPRRWARPDPRR